MMNKKKMMEYYKTYNKSVDEALATFYTDDAVFEYQDVRLNGKKEIVNHFAEIQKAVKEVMKPLNILIAGDKVAVEVENFTNINGAYVMDVRYGDRLVIVEYRPGQGYGVSLSERLVFGDKPDDVVAGVDAATSRVLELLRTGAGT